MRSGYETLDNVSYTFTYFNWQLCYQLAVTNEIFLLPIRRLRVTFRWEILNNVGKEICCRYLAQKHNRPDSPNNLIIFDDINCI